jgi:hypothetical protein
VRRRSVHALLLSSRSTVARVRTHFVPVLLSPSPGYPINAWQFWVSTGVVTGGAFGSTGTCQPYTWAPCSHHTKGSALPKCVAQPDTPACSNQCQNAAAFHQDKTFGSSAYSQ